VPQGGPGDVDAAVAAAVAALPRWSGVPPLERAEHLRRIADELESRQEHLARLIALELGMPLEQCLRIQVPLGVGDLRAAAAGVAGIAWEERVGNSVVHRVPVGVVAAITPWNYPLHQITAKVGAALAAGCTVVVKPSELTPLSAYALAEIVHDLALPAGVVNVVPGLGAVVGEALVRHPDVDIVSFTGSTRAGRRISALAAESLTPVTMELGGKSAAIVLDDADLGTAIETTLAKGFQNCGQTCNALTRILVPVGRLHEAEAVAASTAASYVVGGAFEPGVSLGPVISETQRAQVVRYIESGVAEGATLVVGGPEGYGDRGPGHFVRPTVFSGVTPSMTIAREEIFGPVICILGYTDEDDAVRIANDSDYGLSGAVWSRDQARAVAVARRIRTGQVSINGGPYNGAAPFGGFKHSGHGREGGRFGIEEFLSYQSLQLPVDAN
jgi:acyl-CoA reductase-like NAD-dependent aldehyde dehydrogenase